MIYLTELLFNGSQNASNNNLLIRHGESLKTFEGGNILTPEKFELYRPISSGAKEKNHDK